MSMGQQKFPPLDLKRNLCATLVEQLTSGIEESIRSGFYRPGDVLPPLRTLAERLGVSMQVTRAALDRLKEKGLVNSRPRLGCVVLGRHERLWNGNILFVDIGNEAVYYSNVFAGEMQRETERAGYVFNRISMPCAPTGRRSGAADLDRLDLALSRGPDVAVILALYFDVTALVRHISAKGVRCVVIGNDSFDDPRVGVLKFDRSAAINDLAKQAKREGVRKIAVVDWQKDVWPDAFAKALRGHGFEVEELVVPPKRDCEWPECVVRSAYERFRRGPAPSADLLVFADDYTARGAIVALAGKGIETPRAFRLATWANAGNVPVHPYPTSLILMDPRRDAAKLVELLLKAFETGTPPAHTFAPEFVPAK